MSTVLEAPVVYPVPRLQDIGTRKSVDVTLLSEASAEPNDMNVVFDVTASVRVRLINATDECPGECLVEDIEIEQVRNMTMSWGEFGSSMPGDTPFLSMRQIENQRRLEWLNSQLEERDDWVERITAKALGS